MNAEIKFRTQFSGYNKEDVNNYIKENDIKYSAKLDEVNKTIVSLQEELSALKTQYEFMLKSAVAEKTQAVDELNDLREKYESSQNDYKAQSDVIISMTDDLMAERSQNEALRGKIEALEKDCGDSRHIIEQKDSEITEKDGLIKNLTAEIEEKNRLLAEKEAAAAEEADKNSMEAEPAASEPQDFGDINDKDSPAYKLAMYDKISAGLGDLMISANRNADSILTEAREEAERLRRQTDDECDQKVRECDAAVIKIRSETDEEAAYIRDRLSSAANDLLKTVSSDLHVNLENCVREIETGIADMQYEIKTLLQKIEGRRSEMNERIDYYQSCVSDGIKTKLDSMDEKYGINHEVGGDA